MKSSFGQFSDEALDLAYSEAARAERARRNKEATERRMRAREEKRAAQDRERASRPKKTWGNFLR